MLLDPRQYRNHKKGPGNVHPQPMYQQAQARSLCNSQVFRVNRVAEVKGSKEAFRIIQRQQDFTKQMLEDQRKVINSRRLRVYTSSCYVNAPSTSLCNAHANAHSTSPNISPDFSSHPPRLHLILLSHIIPLLTSPLLHPTPPSLPHH